MLVIKKATMVKTFAVMTKTLQLSGIHATRSQFVLT